MAPEGALRAGRFGAGRAAWAMRAGVAGVGVADVLEGTAVTREGSSRTDGPGEVAEGVGADGGASAAESALGEV